jgi:hypothetical protein
LFRKKPNASPEVDNVCICIQKHTMSKQKFKRQNSCK